MGSSDRIAPKHGVCARQLPEQFVSREALVRSAFALSRLAVRN